MSFPKRKAPHNVRVLDQWVRAYAAQEGVAAERVRRFVSFMVLELALERAYDNADKPCFVIKGGVSLELRLRLRARTTKDFDAVFRGRFEEWLERLDDAIAEPIAGFTFSRREADAIGETGSYRVRVQLSYRGNAWGSAQLEVAPVEEEHLLDIDHVEPFDISVFGLPEIPHVPVAGLPYLIAQKLHACTEVYDDGAENLRVHDVPDLLMARGLLADEPLRRAREACEGIFASRGKQAWPPTVTVHPSWPAAYARIVEDEGLPIATIDDAVRELRNFIAEIAAADIG